MSSTLNFTYEDLQVSVSYESSTSKVMRSVSGAGNKIYHDELTFDKSLVANFELMSAEEQAKIVHAWGAAGIKTRIEEGQIAAKK